MGAAAVSVAPDAIVTRTGSPSLTRHGNETIVSTPYHVAFPSKYVKAADLAGRRLVVTVGDVSFADVGSGQNTDRKLVVRFRESDAKSLVLNRINCETIAELAGSDDIDQWPGTRIELYPAKTEFGGKRVDCIRIAAPAPSPAARAVATTSPTIAADEEVGF